MSLGPQTGEVAALGGRSALIAPFALVSAITGALAHATGSGFTSGTAVAAVIGGASGALAGLIMTDRRVKQRSWPQLLVVVITITIVAWIAVAVLMDHRSVWALEQLLPVLLGAAAPLIAFLGLAFVIAGYRAALAPRPHSLLARWGRRRPWMAAALTTGLSAAIAGAANDRVRPVGLILLATALSAVFVLWVRDRSEARRVRSAAESIDRRVDEGDPNEWDLGEGDERWLCMSSATHPYRSAERPRWILRGNLLPILRRLENAVVLEFCLMAALLGMLTYLVFRPPTPYDDRLPRYVEPIPSVPASATATPTSLTWYPNQTPILVDINGDGIEDIIGIRWDDAHPEAALAVSANDGATLRLLWTTERVACQWASSHMRLARSGSRLFLSDSEGFVRVYELSTGNPVGQPLKLVASEECAVDAAQSSVWMRDNDDWSKRDQGVLVDAKAHAAPSRRPKSCVAYFTPRPDGATVDTKCDKRANKTTYSVGIVRNDVGVRLGSEHEGDPFGSLISGYDPVTCRQTYKQSLAFTLDEYHREPHLTTQLSGDRVIAFYQVKDGRWILGARDARDGHAMWHVEPPRAHYGTNFESMTASSQRVYVGLNWRLEVFNPATGDSIGVVW